MMRFLHNPLPATTAAALAALAVVACGSNDQRDTASIPADTMSMAAPAADSTTGMAGQQLNDARIADIAETANSIDSSGGALALQKASSKAVKDFAQTMIHDHSAANQKAEQLASQLGLSPEANDVSHQLEDQADQATSNLNGLSGAAFDRAYMDHEIAFHQSVLASLDNTLIPDAQNAELKQLLTSIRPTIEGHLKRAQAVRKDLGN
jgi:putative membrane protein